MAAYIPVPRDLTRVKTKVFFNLTKRQLLCFGAAALIGVPIFFLVKATGNVSLAALSMMIVMLPLFFLAMYEKDSQPLEVVVEHFIQTKFVRPKVRPYLKGISQPLQVQGIRNAGGFEYGTQHLL